MPKPLLYVITDFGGGGRFDLADGELLRALAPHVPDTYQIVPISVGSFNVIEAAFVLAQLADTMEDSAEAERTKFFVNVAPRKDDSAPRVGNAGEPFVLVTLKSGVRIIAANSGPVLSLLKGQFESIRGITIKTTDQFRSREIARKRGQLLWVEDGSLLGSTIAESAIPEMSDNLIGYIDGNGNIKTTCTAGTFGRLGHKDGSFVSINIGGETKRVRVSTGMFAVAEDSVLCIHPGSSGYGNRFMEITVRGKSAAGQFANIRPGMQFSISQCS